MKIETHCSTGKRFPDASGWRLLWKGHLRDLMCDRPYPPLA